MKFKVLLLAAVFGFVANAHAQEEWKAVAGLSGIMNSGNAENQTIGGNALVSVKQGMDQVTWNAVGAYGRAKDPATGTKTTNTENWLTQVRYDRFLTDTFSLYGLGRMNHDKPAGIDLNYGASPGLSKFLYKTDRTGLRTELGFDFTRQRFVSHAESNIYAVRFFLQFTHKFNETTSLGQDVENLFNVTERDDYRLNTLTSLNINMSKKVAFQLGYAIRLDNQPVPGFKKVDTTTQFGLNINIL